jgi:hypothetical protein
VPTFWQIVLSLSRASKARHPVIFCVQIKHGCHNFCSKTNQIHNISNLFYFVTTLYNLRTVWPSIKRSQNVHTAPYHTDSVAACYQAATESLWHIPDAVCTVLDSCWWTERPSETCRVFQVHGSVHQRWQQWIKTNQMHTSLKIIKTLLYSYSPLHVSGSIAPIIRSLLILYIQPPVTVYRWGGCIFQLWSVTTVAFVCLWGGITPHRHTKATVVTDQSYRPTDTRKRQ